jgi:hypothetical protein
LWTNQAFVDGAHQPLAIDRPIAILFVPTSVKIKVHKKQTRLVDEFIGQWNGIDTAADSIGLTLTRRSNDGIRIGVSLYEWLDPVMPWHCFGVMTVWPGELPVVTFGPIDETGVIRALGQRHRALVSTAL